MVKKVTEKEFNENNEGLTLVDFYADWCGPCKMVGPIIDNLSEEMEDVKFQKINVDEENALAAKYKVSSIPTIILFKDGVEVDRVIGFAPKPKLQSWIQSNK